MKVNATFAVKFNVTREVEIDEPDFLRWARDRYGEQYDVELAVAAWIDAQDTEFLGAVLHDWRISDPLPRDFELQYVSTEDVTIETVSDV